MIRFYQILFLSISIFFSFGFSSYQHNEVCELVCETNSKEKACHSEKEVKSCCSKPEKEGEKEGCCGENDCCYVVSDILHFESFVSNSSIEIKTIIHHSYNLFVVETNYFNPKEVYFSDNLFNNKEFQYPHHSNFDLSFKQSWLI